VFSSDSLEFAGIVALVIIPTTTERETGVVLISKGVRVPTSVGSFLAR